MPVLPDSFKPVHDSYMRGDISYTEFVEQADAAGVTVAMHRVDERHPAYPEGNNSSRVYAFTHYINSIKGNIFQRIMKPWIIRCVDRWHRWIIGDWDSQAFEYDDTRLKILANTAYGAIDEMFDHQERKLKLMRQGTDILLFMLKEDIYWRGRIFAMMNKMPWFELTELEQENIEIFTDGVEVVDNFTMEAAPSHPANHTMPENRQVTS